MIINGYEIKPCANLSGANLSGADLSYADLSYADLSGADLSYADLSYADLSGANLIYADLRGANLIYADLRGANLIYADLRGANLIYADLRGANLRGAIGNMREIKSLQLDTWSVVWVKDQENKTTLQIGCQRHPLEMWEKSDPRWIATLDPKATEWWGQWKETILGLVEKSPAHPYGKVIDK
ncbi:Pentapeptide repeat [uncultured Caudovirales phage]|uniref:Pentapeptide repeat n=1 Tax=uncultured Caudovirales phage TaxID=2100421 RepID=A0A6J7WY92_9CAUD|nr:Pentapeptide repeat [uncultured Caudovirales phage]CAB5221034.1 Pentapeptide repeat [uncultured Caudovirales phage]